MPHKNVLILFISNCEINKSLLVFILAYLNQLAVFIHTTYGLKENHYWK